MYRIFTDKCMVCVLLSEMDDDGLYWSYDHSEKKDCKYAIHNVIAGGEERTRADIAHFAANDGQFLKALPTLLMSSPFLTKAKKS